MNSWVLQIHFIRCWHRYCSTAGDKGDAVCPSLVSPYSTAAGNGEMSATRTSDLKEYDTVIAAISVKRKTTAAKNRDHNSCYTLVRTALHVTSC
jgi:hypothetical protein